MLFDRMILGYLYLFSSVMLFVGSVVAVNRLYYPQNDSYMVENNEYFRVELMQNPLLVDTISSYQLT